MKEEGFNGMAKGFVKGTTGLLVSPILGICDAGSKTLEGLINSPSIFNGKKASDKRTRFPRPFYTKYYQIKDYEEFDAKILDELRKIDNKMYMKLRIYGIYKLGFDGKK